MRRVFTASVLALLVTGVWPVSGAKADPTSSKRARTVARIVMVLNELVLLEREVKATGNYGGKSDCENKRAGFGRGTVVDTLQCFTKAERKEVTDKLRCDEIPARTGPRAYLWLTKCANSNAAIRMWRDIDCKSTTVRYKASYDSFLSHMTARKCGINQPRSCRLGDDVIAHNEMFVGYEHAVATFDVSSKTGSTCSDLGVQLQCVNGKVKRLGHTKVATSTSCTQRCKSDTTQVTCPAAVGTENASAAEAYSQQGITTIQSQSQAPSKDHGFTLELDERGHLNLFRDGHHYGGITDQGSLLLRSPPSDGYGLSVQDILDAADEWGSTTDRYDAESCLCW